MTEEEMAEHAEYYKILRMNIEDSYIFYNKSIKRVASELKMDREVVQLILESERIIINKGENTNETSKS